MLYKARRKSEPSFSHSSLAIFPFLVMEQISSFILGTVLFFSKNALYSASFLQSDAPYMQTSDMSDPRSEYNQLKSECNKHQQS